MYNIIVTINLAESEKFLIFSKEPACKKVVEIPYDTLSAKTYKEIEDLINIKAQQRFGINIQLEINQNVKKRIKEIAS